MTPRKHIPPDEKPALLQAVHDAITPVPTSPQDVARAENSLASSPQPPLPTQLHDPAAVLAGPTKLPSPPQLAPTTDIAPSLARAARDAGRLTPEILDRMHQDRKAAEAQSHTDNPEAHNGPNVR